MGEPAASWVGTAAAGSFLAALVTWVGMLGRPAPERVADLRIFTWFPVAGLHAGAGLLVDPLSMTMALFVTGVSAVIHMSSVGYMHRDPGLDRFFVYLNLFVFSMAVLVLGDNFVFSFLGWEGVGFCSYALIGFWFRRDVAAVAANKAFFTNWSSPTARYQGAVAAKNMLGRPLAYDQVPYFFSDQYDLGMEFRGWAPSFDRVVFRGDPASSQFIAFWLQDGKVLAAMNANVWDGGVEIESLLRGGQPVDLGRLTDPDVELASLAELKA